LPGGGGAGIAVARDDHVPRFEIALPGADVESLAVLLYGGGRAMRRHCGAGAKHTIQKAPVISRRVQGSVMGIDHPAVVGVGAELAPLLGALHDVGTGLEARYLARGGSRQHFVMPRSMGGVKSSRHFEIALDALRIDERFDPGQCLMALLEDRECALPAVPRCERREIRFDAGADLPAVAGAASPAGVLRVQHHRVPAGACGLQRGVEPRVPRAYDGYVRPGG
jgi:hypothetical protein